MDSFLGRYRNLIVLVGVLFAQVLGLAVQVKRTNDAESTRLIRVWVVGTVSPLEKLLVWAQNSTGNLWHNYFYLRGVRAENRELKQEIDRMRVQEARLSQDADQARRLQALLGFKQRFISQTLAAQVIGSSGSEQSRAVYIDKGEKGGVKPDMAVITADGVVGKVLRVYRSTSLVLLINDQTSGVGAILEKSRLQGILRGTPGGEVALEKVMSDEAVQVGELVLTSGGDRIFPKGLVVGRVTKVSPGNDLFLNIRVKPAANLSKLEEVLVVTKIDERQAEPDQTATARAADILAARLPTVPPKPASEPAAASAAGTIAPGTRPAANPGEGLKPKTPAPAGALTAGTASTAASPAAKPGEGLRPKPSAPAGTTATGSAVVGARPPVKAGNATRPKAPAPVAEAGTQADKKPSSTASPVSVKTAEKPVKPAVDVKPPAQDDPH